MSSPNQLGHVGSRRLADHAFTAATRGPADPPPLGAFVDFRPESSRRWWACDAAGNVVAMCASHEEAQKALGKVNSSKEASNG